MFEKMNQKGNSRWTFFIILAMLTLWITPLYAGQTATGDSPEAVFKAGRAAGAKRDFAALAKLIAASEHSMLAFETDMGVSMFLAFYEGKNAAELNKRYEKIQTKYKIKNMDKGEKLQINQDTPQEVIDAHILKRAQSLYGHVDVVKYIPELMALVINMPELANHSFFPQEDLASLKIDGDTASGTAGVKKISFIREGDRWRLTADAMD